MIPIMTLVMAALTTAPSARAALGETVDSVTVDRMALSATRSIATMTHANYTILHVQSDAVTVREYISSLGTVFGVAWNGLVYPDLTQLLGSYANEYQKAQRRTLRIHGQRMQQVNADRVVVEKMGAYAKPARPRLCICINPARSFD